MTIQSATPYLILFGKARAAISLYERAFQAKLETLQRFGDVDQSCPAARRDFVMHAALRVGQAQIFLSDGAGESKSGTGAAGGVVSVAIELDDPAQAHAAFDVLASSGTVVERLFDAPWGALFGAVRDEFGIDWMFNCPRK
jgi:PhnB protein